MVKSISDGRNPFENDYSRIILSSCFRRLQDKTQVYPLDDSDFIRTRLTHSIEVSAIASSIGASVEQFLLGNRTANKKMGIEYKGHIKSILASAGLLHDMGNTPFGHFGEYAVQEFFKNFFKDPKNEHLTNQLTKEQRSDFENFDANAHVLRLVTKLQYIQDIYGLNLTYATLATLLKYPRSSIEGNKKSEFISYKKYGYFQSEKETFDLIVENTNIKRRDGKVCRHPLVFLLEAADDIAYSVADIEDGIKKKIITLEDVNNILEQVLYYNDDNSRRNITEKEEELFLTLKLQIDDGYINSEERIVQIFRARVQNFMIESVVEKFVEEYDSIMNGRFDHELLNVSCAGRIRKAFKEIAKNIFNDKEIIQNELAGEKVVTNLLILFVGAVTNMDDKRKLLFQKNGTKESRLYEMISDNYRYIYSYHSSKTLYDRLLLVTDYISGMTDYYALRLYKSLNGISV